jgi:hypothetical protein
MGTDLKSVPTRNDMGMAEREGFEPSVRFWRTHTFQACSFDRSDTSPEEYRTARAWEPRDAKDYNMAGFKTIENR